jgi:hypothetical protein
MPAADAERVRDEDERGEDDEVLDRVRILRASLRCGVA